MRSTTRGLLPAGVAATVVAGLLTVAGAGAQPASAAACDTPELRYAKAPSNTLYLRSGTVELPRLKAICPDIPLTREGTSPVWYLAANLKVESGARLKISGGPTVPPADRVDHLKLRSEAGSTKDTVVEITAQWGAIDIRSTRITSWDPARGAVDTDPKVPAGVVGGKGRAFIRAVSYLEGSLERESRLDITDSELSHLGCYGGEAYGVSYKARGCGIETPAALKVCDTLDVGGSQRGSNFHHNYFGTYTWGAEGMVFDRNIYADNVMYGLDPHDDSDNLTITGNRAHRNGTHGIICSQRCNGLTISGNTVHSNGIPPYLPEGDTDPTDNQVHGIMLHRGVTDSVVKDNIVYNHPNGAGIAVFDSMNDAVVRNTLTGNKYGLRTSVGSSGILFQDNTIRNSLSHAVFAYPGVKDKSVYANPVNSHPVRNTFVGNTFDSAKSTLVNLLSSDGFEFRSNTVKGTVGPIVADGSVGLVWQGSRVPAKRGIELCNGSAGTVVATTTGSFPLKLDPTSRLTVGSPNGLLAEVSGLKLYSDVKGGVTSLTITGGATFGSSARTVTIGNAAARASSGRLSARPQGFETRIKRIVVRSASPKSAVTYRVGRLRPGVSYVVTVNGRKLLQKVTSPRGTLSFALSRKGAAGHTISVKPAR